MQKLQIHNSCLLPREKRTRLTEWQLTPAHTLPCVMMPVCRPAVDFLVLYATRVLRLCCRLSWRYSSSRVVDSALLACLDWTSFDDAVMQFQNNVVKTRANAPPSPTEWCSSSIQVKHNHREKLGLYHSIRKNREDGCLSREIWKNHLQ